jgi:GntP family gluconate:H+ symporter
VQRESAHPGSSGTDALAAQVMGAAERGNPITGRLSTRDRWAIGLLFAGLILSVYLRFTTQAPTLWGLLPVVLYAALVLLGVDVVLATLGALLSAVLLTGTEPKPLADLLAQSLGSFIAVVGLIVIMGAGLGQVARETGAAEYLVRTILYRIGLRTRTRVQIGVMLVSTLLVASLGTLAGANAILAPIVIPIVAAVGFTPPALAAMLHAAGAPGLFIGPFTPPVVTLTGTAGIEYLPYLGAAGLPMAAVTWGTGFFMARWIQRRTEGTQAYEESDLVKDERQLRPEARWATLAFVLTLLAMLVYGIVTRAGYSYALLVMLVTSFTTGLAGRLSPTQILRAIYAGASRLIWLFLLFWLFNPILTLVEQTKAYQALLDAGRPLLGLIGAYEFGLISILIGWLGVSGAAVAQVVLMNEVLGPIVQQVGLSSAAWVAVLLATSQLDWFGPFPNADMIGQMGLARSRDLRRMLYNGWAIMAANTVLFVVLLRVLT